MHSQGGLLTKMMVVEGGDRFVRGILGLDIGDLGLTPEQEELFRWAFYFEPLPFVRQVVFISTPHRGSFLTEKLFSQFFNKMIDVPGNVAGAATRIFSDDSMTFTLSPKENL